MVTNFDNSQYLSEWDSLGGTMAWRTFTASPRSAPAAMRTGTINYLVNSTLVLQLKPDHGLNLDAYADNNNWIKLYWYQKGVIGAGDSAFIEVSKDGIAWQVLKYRTGITTSWLLDSADVGGILGTKAGNDSILFRFNFKSNSATTAYGWLLDRCLPQGPAPFPSGVAGKPEELVVGVFALDQNRPNPFRGQTAIKYQLPSQSPVRLNIYNISGQLVRTLVNAKQLPGHYNIIWNGRDNSGRPVSAGVYFYRLNAGDASLTRKMVLLK